MELAFASKRRNHMLMSHRRDHLIEWMKEILNHGFVLDAQSTYQDSFEFFEELVIEHMSNPHTSRLKSFVPTVGTFHTPLKLRQAFEIYDTKYAVSQRRHICPSFNELRHILNLAQVLAIGSNLRLITFDGDQTLYTDGGNFEDNHELAKSIIDLLKSGVIVAIITAAGYGYDGTKYAVRLSGLINSFITHNLTAEQVSQFYVFGGECNYLLQANLDILSESVSSSSASFDASFNIPLRQINLKPHPFGSTNMHLEGLSPNLNPQLWPEDEIRRILDLAENSMRSAARELRLRAKILRKERAVGMFPGGSSMVESVHNGHGSKKLKTEALDETVMRVMEDMRTALAARPSKLPFCVFNGGRDAWCDIGNKGVAIAVLQSMLNLTPSSCLHVGDQFLAAGNDFAAREMCPTVWITSPLETQKILEYVSELKIDDHAHTMPGTNGNADPYAGSCGASLPTTLGLKRRRSSISKPSIDVETSRFNVYTG